MAVRIKIEVIKPKKVVDPKRVQKVINSALDEWANGMKADFEKTTATWQHKPKFKINKRGGYRSVWTDDEIYQYITRGTRVRYATMTKGYGRKTRPRYITSYKGRGGVLFISRKHPRPGIEARQFDIVISDRWGPKGAKMVQDAINKEV